MKLNDEKDLAADRRARSEAVKLDLKADFKGLRGRKRLFIEDVSSSLGWKTRKSRSSTPMPERG